MAKLILRDAYLLVNAVDLSDHVQSVEINPGRADQDATAMGAVGKQRLPGLKDEQVVVNFRQDFAASKVDQTLWTLYDQGTSFAIEIRPTSGARSTTNPAWTGTAYLIDYAPVAGAVGDVLDAKVTFVIDNQLTRQTA
jgi:hypothetical protein